MADNPQLHAALEGYFSHGRDLGGPDDTFVTINNDTVYSMAQLDLSVGPVQLHVPDTAGRYDVRTVTRTQVCDGFRRLFATGS